jgi:hypothetical protein
MNSTITGRSKLLSGLVFALALAANSAAGAGEEAGKFSGTVKFSSNPRTSDEMGMGLIITEGTATVTWTLVEELPDVRTYSASGTISGKVAPEIDYGTCEPVTITRAIEAEGGQLTVYTERANWNPSTYGFFLSGVDNDPLTTTCTDDDGDEFPVTFMNLLMVGVGHNCMSGQTPRPVPFTDPEVLEGTFDCPGSSMAFVGIRAEWSFTGELGDAILEITPSGGYKKWRPTADRNGGDGEPVEFTATLKTRDGGVPNYHIKELEWELMETSAEPGFTINWPQRPGKNEPDLYFKDLPATTPGAVRRAVGETGQKVIVTYSDDGKLSDSISVHPRDWGGWSTLQVTAVLNDDRRVRGRLAGASEDGARLPDRDPGRYIARSWLSDKGISDGDRSDLEDQPKGDSNKGDGLTLYEEYRGFYKDGERVEGDPKLKDMFIVNEGGAAGTAGIALFQRITGLWVHGTLKPEETDASRVVNHNASGSPRLGPQHAVLIKVDPKQKGQAEAVTANDRPGTPGKVEYVGLPTSFPARPTKSPATNYAAITVAHELLHAVNVYHHGEGDKVVFWSRDANGRLFEQKTKEKNPSGYEPVGNGIEIRTFLESGQDVTEQTRLGFRNLGQQHGQHSGHENCVMRYDIADSYVSITNPSHRYVHIEEIQGAGLDNTAEGDHVNAFDWVPQSRYGKAAENRGNCQSQILVNDMVPPPAR